MKENTNRIEPINDDIRNELLANFILFSQLDAKDIQEFAQLTQGVRFNAGESIVTEGDLIDSFYFIVKGKAEAIQNQPIDGRIKEVILAVLNEKNTIGLDSKGFFSPDGKRTATVTALSDIILLRIDIQSFHSFIDKHPSFDTILKDTSKLLAKIDFIKQFHPFSNLNNEEIISIIKQMREISLPTNTVIFNKGDLGDGCYIIRKGQVEIFLKEQDGTEKKLALLDSPALFGEAALLTSNPRNASARSKSDSELFFIERNLFLDVIKQNIDFAHATIGYMVKNFRPTRSPEVIEHKHTSNENLEVVMLENTLLNQYYRLNEASWFIWQQLDGTQTVQDISIAFFKKFHVIVPDVICNILYTMNETGFVTIPSIDSYSNESSLRTYWQKIKYAIGKVADIEFSFTQTYRWLNPLYRNGIKIFYTWPIQIIFLILIVAGFAAFIGNYTHISNVAHHVLPHFWIYLLLIIPVSTLVVLIHEAAHAFTAIRLGYKVQRIGIGWYWLGPMAYVDTSELWTADKRSRLQVNMAGIYIELVLAGGIAILAAIVHNAELSIFLWLISLLIYYGAFKNSSPVKEFDGYYILSDLLDNDRLRKSSMRWMAAKLYHLTDTKGDLKPRKAEIFYWICSLTYIIASALFVFIILQLLFNIFSVGHVIGIPKGLFSLFISIAYFTLAMFSIGHEVKSLAKKVS